MNTQSLTGEAGGSAGRAAVVHVSLLRSRRHDGAAGAGAAAPHAPAARRDLDAKLEEAVSLTQAIGLDVAHAEAIELTSPRPATLLGSGKVEALKAIVAEAEITVTVIDCPLSPIQQRNLERALGCKVIDRTGLILEIFGARARTREGRLQVELASLNYQKSRLVRSWTHLERQRGGFGFLGGPGETQIEADRRQIRERIAKLKQELETVVKTRALHRKARRRVPYPVVALVGYTNAGKSTLFNRLTGAAVSARDQLFATLDPTMRGVDLPSGRRIILSDTVGFVSDLPHDLVAAFRATLEEVVEADIILHVRDIAHPDTAAQLADVHAVLREMGLAERIDSVMIEVLNKIDRLDPDRRAALLTPKAGLQQPRRIAVSALTGEGIEALLAAIDAKLSQSRIEVDLGVAPADGAGLAWLYRHGEVLQRRDEADRIILKMRLAPETLDKAMSRPGVVRVEPASAEHAAE
ncbi:MAG: GTPase HflX [Alphaproteobacteria bacterium]